HMPSLNCRQSVLLSPAENRLHFLFVCGPKCVCVCVCVCVCMCVCVCVCVCVLNIRNEAAPLWPRRAGHKSSSCHCFPQPNKSQPHTHTHTHTHITHARTHR